MATTAGDVGNDLIDSTVDSSQNVTIGKENVQNVINVGADEQHRNAEDTHVITVRLLNDWLGRFEKRMDRESEDRRKAQDELRRELEEIKHVVGEMANRFSGTLRLPYGHMQIFAMAFILLWAPTPLYLDSVRTAIGISSLFTVLTTAAAYMMSAFLWGYLWFGGGR